MESNWGSVSGLRLVGSVRSSSSLLTGSRLLGSPVVVVVMVLVVGIAIFTLWRLTAGFMRHVAAAAAVIHDAAAAAAPVTLVVTAVAVVVVVAAEPPVITEEERGSKLEKPPVRLEAAGARPTLLLAPASAPAQRTELRSDDIGVFGETVDRASKVA